MLADILWASWVMLEFASEAQQPTEQPRTLLVSLVKELLIEETLLPRNVLMKVADGAMLAQAGLVVDAEVFHKKQVRLHTKLVYAQQKFNLLREDSEGYAKLLAALGAFVALQHPSDNAIAYLVYTMGWLFWWFYNGLVVWWFYNGVVHGDDAWYHGGVLTNNSVGLCDICIFPHPLTPRTPLTPPPYIHTAYAYPLSHWFV